jgi:peroxiredoxin
MKLNCLIFALCIIASYCHCQSFSLNDPNTIFKDSLGNNLTSGQVTEMAIKNSLSISKTESQDGKTIVTVKVLSRKNQTVNTESEWTNKWKGASLPDFELADFDGRIVTKANLAGKVIVINFWFTRCGPCIAEMPELNKLVEKYKDQEVVFLAPGLDSKEEITKLLVKHQFEYRILPNAESFAKSLEVKFYPVNAVVNQSGTITELINGTSSSVFEHLDNQIATLLKRE